MKILLICQYFPPEIGALAARASELARHWALAGHQVTILTGFPNYPSGAVPFKYRCKLRRLVYRENVDGYQVVRTWLTTLSNRTTIGRVLGYLSFCLSASLTGSFLKSPDVVISSSPPTTVGLSGWWISIIKRVPFIIEIRDLWPESIIASGKGQDESTFIRLVNGLTVFLYKVSDHIVVVTPAFKDELIKNWDVSSEKIFIVTNGVETDFFKPGIEQHLGEDEEGQPRKFIVSYIGNFGWAQGLETVIEVADLLRSDFQDIYFHLIGAGADYDSLHEMVSRKNLTNVKIIPQQPRQKIPRLICDSAICLVLLRNKAVFKTVIPSKMLEVFV